MSSERGEMAEAGGSVLRAIHDLLPAYVAYVDADLRYVAANRMYVERFGRPEEQIVGRLVADVTGPAFENVARHLRAALRGEEQHFEPHMISIDGERVLSVSHLPHRDANGEVVGVVVYGYDITDRSRAEAALVQSEKLAAVGRLASSIAHEINNPLESVVNLLYLVEQTVEQDAAQARRYALLAQAELARVSQISTQTLQFFRQSTDRREVALAEVLDSVLALYAGRLANSEIEVQREYRGSVPLVCFDGELRQAMNNLVGNAIDAMRRGGRLRVRLRRVVDTLTGHPGVRITVADNGAGIAEQDQKRIFEAFFTTKGITGTGLGLWITLSNIEKQGGRMRMRSRQELEGSAAPHGTVFVVFLPDASA